MHREEGYLHGRELDKAEGDNGGEESDRRDEIQGTVFLANGIACTWVRDKRGHAESSVCSHLQKWSSALAEYICIVGLECLLPLGRLERLLVSEGYIASPFTHLIMSLHFKGFLQALGQKSSNC